MALGFARVTLQASSRLSAQGSNVTNESSRVYARTTGFSIPSLIRSLIASLPRSNLGASRAV